MWKNNNNDNYNNKLPCIKSDSNSFITHSFITHKSKPTPSLSEAGWLACCGLRGSGSGSGCWDSLQRECSLASRGGSLLYSIGSGLIMRAMKGTSGLVCVVVAFVQKSSRETRTLRSLDCKKAHSEHIEGKIHSAKGR